MVPGTAEAGLCTYRAQKPQSTKFFGVFTSGKGTRQHNGKFVTTNRWFCSGNLFVAFGKVRASASILVCYKGKGGMSNA
jgi:hypothetical protein